MEGSRMGLIARRGSRGEVRVRGTGCNNSGGEGTRVGRSMRHSPPEEEERPNVVRT